MNYCKTRKKDKNEAINEHGFGKESANVLRQMVSLTTGTPSSGGEQNMELSVRYLGHKNSNKNTSKHAHLTLFSCFIHGVLFNILTYLAVSVQFHSVFLKNKAIQALKIFLLRNNGHS